VYKIAIIMGLLLSGCANVTVNGTICDNVGTGSDRDLQGVPQECRDYDEKKADKAFHKVTEEKKVSDKDIKFDKEEEE